MSKIQKIIVLSGIGLIVILMVIILISNSQKITVSEYQEPKQALLDESDPFTADIDTSDWIEYQNEELGFELAYSSDWPQPVETNGSPHIFFIDNEEIVINPSAGFNLGPVFTNACEGSDCYVFHLDVFDSFDKEFLLEKIQADKLSHLLSTEVNSHGVQTITFIGAGICGDLLSFLITDSHTVRLISRCGADSDSEKMTHQAIVDSFRLIDR